MTKRTYAEELLIKEQRIKNWERGENLNQDLDNLRIRSWDFD
ncbi:MAG TPA: hypothetical protein VEC16_00715 [Alphaproteobacteria bacterium]|nr:hypothetical protein [Alphaproteobacteria bacterium]